MSLLQRITTPFGEPEQDDPARMSMPNAAGELLRERRQQLRLDLDPVAEALCIKPVYLAAIEQGRTEELPGPTYAIGFIRAYATYLGLDGERVVDLYREEMAEAQTRPDLTLPVPLEERSVPGARILLTGLVLALCGYGTWYYVSTGERARPERVAAVPAELQQLTAPVPGEAPASGAMTAAPPAAAVAQPAAAMAMPAKSAATPQFASGVLTPPPQATSAPAAAASDTTPFSAIAAGDAPANPGPASGGPVESAALPGSTLPGATHSGSTHPGSTAASGGRPEDAAANPLSATLSGSIDIRALADSWVQIRDADQGIVFARVLKAGETYRVPRSGLILRTGNAGALEVLVDGKPAPALGALGTLRRDVRLEPGALRAGTAVRG